MDIYTQPVNLTGLTDLLNYLPGYNKNKARKLPDICHSGKQFFSSLINDGAK